MLPTSQEKIPDAEAKVVVAGSPACLEHHMNIMFIRGVHRPGGVVKPYAARGGRVHTIMNL